MAKNIEKEMIAVTIDNIDDDTKYRIVEETGGSKVITGATLKEYLAEGTLLPYVEVVQDGDDKGLIFTQQVSVGTPEFPKESIFGEGDSYGVGKEDTTPDGEPAVGSAWHCDIATTTNMTITGATDITTILTSDAGSTTGS